MKSERKLTAEEARREAHECVCVYEKYPHPECKCLAADCCTLHDLIDVAIATAVREEREACAKMCYHTWQAKLIRSRCEVKE